MLTLSPRLSLSSQPATGLSALAPAQRAGAQRLCALALAGEIRCPSTCRLSGSRPETAGAAKSAAPTASVSTCDIVVAGSNGTCSTPQVLCSALKQCAACDRPSNSRCITHCDRRSGRQAAHVTAVGLPMSRSPRIWTHSKRTSLARRVDGIADCPQPDFSNPGGAAGPAAHPAAARPADARTGGAG